MSGPTLTLTVSPAVPDPNHSLSSLPALTAPASSASSPRRRSLSVKSLPTLPNFDHGLSLDFFSDLDTSFTLSYDDIKRPTDEVPGPPPSDNSAVGLAPSSHTMGGMMKKRSILARPVSWMPSSKSSPGLDELDLPGSSKDDSHDKPRVSSNPLTAAFARRSWIGSSVRTPSPSGQDDVHLENAAPSSVPPPPPEPAEETPRGLMRSATETSLNKLKKSSRRTNGAFGSSEGSKSTDSMGKLGGYFSRKKAQVVAPKVQVPSGHESTGSSTTSLAPPSIEARPSHASETSNSTAPDEVVTTSAPAMSRDPLWSFFKSLECEYGKFQARTVTTKATIVRSTLLPFLRKFGSHPSNRRLHPADLEKRAIILNNWWTGILDMLHSKNQQPVPGVDKPCLFEALTLLMTRPEWRFSTPSFCALSDRNPKERLRKWVRSSPSASSSQDSFKSSEASFAAESADHNVRTMFTSRLMAQLVFVIDKLSSRHAPLSLVNFAGKACAFAFIFCQDAANVLVRLWGLKADSIRRVTDELGLPRRSKGESDDIVALFPPNLEELGWTSVKSTADMLKRSAPLPLGTAKTPWHGPWVSRWQGRDTDLFFVFCKYYFALAEDFIPPGLPLVEKARAPAFVLVNAQMLSILDSTIHRQAPVGHGLNLAFMDADQGADTSLFSMPPAPNSNAFRGMSENRLIVLLRDMLCAPNLSVLHARHTFAEVFMTIMKASAKRTSQFNHNACFTICDFLEESLPIFEEFVTDDDDGLSSVSTCWQFWFDVLGKIAESNNTMSEIRVISLLFSIWDVVTNDPARKEAVCLDWLLTEEVFNKFFNNWCPMVRAYYMRLLCWRICRDTGAANDLNAKIFLTVWTRLKMVWSHYLWLRQSAEHEGKFLPSTAPSYPTPGKRFMIIRHEVAPPQSGLLVGFDQFSPQSSTAEVPSGPATSFDTIEIPEHMTAPQYKKKWGLFGKVLSFSGNNPSPDDLEALRRETASLRGRPIPPPKGHNITDAYQVPASDADSMGSSPTFEAVQYIFKFTLSWNAPGTPAPLHRILGRPRLPGPAQAVVNLRDRSAGLGALPPAGRPAPTRAVSGSISSGLIDGARNAGPISTSSSDSHRGSDASERASTPESASPADRPSGELSSPNAPSMNSTVDSITYPVEPTGNFTLGVKYAGRALAEWGLVVGEYNGFVDRRRDEGVMGLSEVEVPSLSVEGFRKH